MNQPELQNDKQTEKTPVSRLKKILRMIRVAVIAVVIVALGLGLFLYFNIYLPMGEGPAGPMVPEAPFNHIWIEQPVVLYGLGDSITDGFGADKGFSYFDRLLENPTGDVDDMVGKNLSRVFPELTSLNRAESGSISIDHLRMARQVEVQSPDVFGLVVMTCGGNDLIHNYGKTPPVEGAMYGATFQQAQPWIKNYRQRLDEIVAIIHDKFPGGCHIFLGNIYDPSDGTGDTKEFFTGLPEWPDALKILDAYNRIIAECALKHDDVHLVDLHSLFLGHGIHCRKFWTGHYQWSDPTYWYFINIEDPSERGYDAIRRLFLLKMIEVFENESAGDS